MIRRSLSSTKVQFSLYSLKAGTRDVVGQGIIHPTSGTALYTRALLATLSVDVKVSYAHMTFIIAFQEIVPRVVAASYTP